MKEDNMFLTPTISPSDIEILIGSVKVNEAVGPNSIPTKISIDYKSELSKRLGDMINTSFIKDIFPNALKVANVTLRSGINVAPPRLFFF